MESHCRTRFLRLCRRRAWLRDFLDRWGEEVDAVDEDGESLLTKLVSDRRLTTLALMLGWRADVVDDWCYPNTHSPLHEACDCCRWEVALLMLRRPQRREALESALYWACLGWWEAPAALATLRGLIEQLGGFCPETLPQLMKLLIMGGVYPLIPEALAAGYRLPAEDSPWWSGDEEAWSSSDKRQNPAWQRALKRFAAECRAPLSPCRILPKRPRRMKRCYSFQYCEREWLHLLRACC